jgi:dihydroorotate dehydrogenase
MIYALVRPLLFALDPAMAHAVAMAALAPLEHLFPLRGLFRAVLRVRDPRLEVRKMGLVFPHPIGLAGGFDKNGERPRALASLGFGHLELGTVTAEAQGPNPPPNMFRLRADRALVNRLGFPNEGAEAVGARIRARRRRSFGIPVGVSIGKSRSVPLDPFDAALADYKKSFRAVQAAADFVVVNVSSPNTKDLRALQAAELAKPLFATLVEESRRTSRPAPVPILVKIAPDLPDEAVDALCDCAAEAGLAGVVATNTTIGREGLSSPAAEVERIGAGGLSGPPVFPRALAVVRRARARLGAEACIIGVGGVHGTESALAMLRAGADLVQLYTALVYEGPGIAATIARGLARQIGAEGGRSLRDITVSSA